MNVVVPLEEILPGIDLSSVPSINTKDYLAVQGFVGDLQLPSDYMEQERLKNLILGVGLPAEDPFAIQLEQLIDFIFQLKDQKPRDILCPLNLLRDQIVVDIGCGKDGAGYFIAQTFGAKAYVGVDYYAAQDFQRNFESGNNKGSREEPRIPLAIISADMEAFIDALPPESVSVFVGGIDDQILNREKRERLARAIPRVVHPHGMFVSYCSNIPIPPSIVLCPLGTWAGTPDLYCTFGKKGVSTL